MSSVEPARVWDEVEFGMESNKGIKSNKEIKSNKGMESNMGGPKMGLEGVEKPRT